MLKWTVSVSRHLHIPEWTKATAVSDGRPRRFLRRVLDRLQRGTSRHGHEAVLSNIDWVIKMLQRVRRDKPAANAQWWESLKRAVPSASNDKHDNEDRE